MTQLILKSFFTFLSSRNLIVKFLTVTESLLRINSFIFGKKPCSLIAIYIIFFCLMKDHVQIVHVFVAFASHGHISFPYIHFVPCVSE